MKTYLHSTLIKYKVKRDVTREQRDRIIYIPLWLNIKYFDIRIDNNKKNVFTFHSD